MADEIIKLIEYITSNGFFQGTMIVFCVIALLVVAGVITVFAVTIKGILSTMKEMRE